MLISIKLNTGHGHGISSLARGATTPIIFPLSLVFSVPITQSNATDHPTTAVKFPFPRRV
jgi:hypothetical protein